VASTANGKNDVRANAFFGSSVAISARGDRVVVSAPTVPPDSFARDVVNIEVGNDDDADEECAGSVYVFDRTRAHSHDFGAVQKIVAEEPLAAGNLFGMALALSSGGSVLVVGANQSIFGLNGQV